MTAEISLNPIGVIHTCFKERYHAPSQPEAIQEQEPAFVVLNPNHNFEQAVQDLEGFDKIWLLSWFHHNNNWKPKVRPPRSVQRSAEGEGNGPPKKRGLFATRSPHRPNGIGLTLTDLLEVKGRKLRVGAIDLLDGTPILDIKPYLPEFEAFPQAATGWVGELKAQKEINPYSIQWSPTALNQLAFLKDQHGLIFKAFAERTLTHDPSPHPYRRVSKIESNRFQLAIKSWRLEFTIEDLLVTVEQIKSGYTREKIIEKSEQETLHNQQAHIDFHAQWPQ